MYDGVARRPPNRAPFSYPTFCVAVSILIKTHESEEGVEAWSQVSARDGLRRVAL